MTTGELTVLEHVPASTGQFIQIGRLSQIIGDATGGTAFIAANLQSLQTREFVDRKKVRIGVYEYRRTETGDKALAESKVSV